MQQASGGILGLVTVVGIGAARRRAAARAVKDLLLPVLDVEVDVLPLLRVLRALAARAREPQLEVLVVSPVAVVELRRGVGLQRISRHVVEDVEERLELELGEVTRLERGRLHVVALRQVELWVSLRRAVGPRRGKGGVQAI